MPPPLALDDKSASQKRTKDAPYCYDHTPDPQLKPGQVYNDNHGGIMMTCDFTAEVLSEVCVDVCTNSLCTHSHAGESLNYATANIEDAVHLDISVAGLSPEGLL